MTHPATAPFKAFAEIIGCKPSYVTELRKAGRLVLTDDGKRVRVAESIARIESTRNPAMQAVTDRHAANRAAKQTAADMPHIEPAPPADKIGNSYQAARAVKERYFAMSARRDYEISIGKLLDAADVRLAVAGATTTLRTRLETLPDIVSPQIAAETDEAKIRAVLAEAIEVALEELARDFRALAQEQAPA